MPPYTSELYDGSETEPGTGEPSTAEIQATGSAVSPSHFDGQDEQSGLKVAAEHEDQDAETEGGEDEPRYCFCNGVSYGQMVGCDNDACPREWFHLQCVNLDEVPVSTTKWFCGDKCREQCAKASGKRIHPEDDHGREPCSTAVETHGQDLRLGPSLPTWYCPECNQLNKNFYDLCTRCGRSFMP